jgi:hypothetical protein
MPLSETTTDHSGLLLYSNLRSLCREHDNQTKEDASRRHGKHYVVGCDATGQPLDPGHWWNELDQEPALGVNGYACVIEAVSMCTTS